MSSKPSLKENPAHTPVERRVVLPELVVILGTVATSTAAIFIRFAQQEAPSLAIAAWRLSLATLLLAPLTLWRHRRELRDLRRGNLGMLALSGLFLALHFATWISSLQYTSVASAVVLVATNPLWVALFSWLLLKEKLSSWVIVGMLVALLGGILISVGDAGYEAIPSSLMGKPDTILWGDLLAVLGALFGAGYIIIGRRLRPTTSLPVYTFTVYGVAAVILVLGVAAVGVSYTGFSPIIYAWFFALAVIPQLFGHSSINWGLRYLPAAFVAIVMLSEPVGSTLLAALFLNEIPTPIKVVGGMLILVGIALSSRQGHGRKTGLPAPD